MAARPIPGLTPSQAKPNATGGGTVLFAGIPARTVAWSSAPGPGSISTCWFWEGDAPGAAPPRFLVAIGLAPSAAAWLPQRSRSFSGGATPGGPEEIPEQGPPTRSSRRWRIPSATQGEGDPQGPGRPERRLGSEAARRLQRAAPRLETGPIVKGSPAAETPAPSLGRSGRPRMESAPGGSRSKPRRATQPAETRVVNGPPSPDRRRRCNPR